MTGFPSGLPCERARAWAALVPDGELSMLEQRLLGAHLERCRACRDFSAQVLAAVAELRAAALQPLPGPIAVAVRHRRGIAARARMVGAAAAVAAMALGIAARGPLSAEQEPFRFPVAIDYSGGDQAEQQELRDLRREEIVAAIAARRRPARHFGHVGAESI
jgi:hypothetical protein